MSKDDNYFSNMEQDALPKEAGGLKQILNKNDCELFHDEDNVVNKIIRVKRIASSKEEKWKIFCDTKTLFVVEGSKLTEKERSFLRGVSGINFLISQGKMGVKSFNDFRKKLKEALPSKTA